MNFGWFWCLYRFNLIFKKCITSVSGVDHEGGCALEQEVYSKSLYLPLNFAANLNSFKNKIKCFKISKLYVPQLSLAQSPIPPVMWKTVYVPGVGGRWDCLFCFWVWSREGFIAGPSKEKGGSGSQKPELPEGFWKSIFKGQVREADHRVWDDLMHKSLTGWWWGSRVLSQGLTLSVLRLPEAWGVWGLRALGHQVVNIFHLVGFSYL